MEQKTHADWLETRILSAECQIGGVLLHHPDRGSSGMGKLGRHVVLGFGAHGEVLESALLSSSLTYSQHDLSAPVSDGPTG